MNRREALGHVFRDPERKSVARIAGECAHCAILEREVPYYYFTSLLHKRESGDYRKFIGHKKIERITREYFEAGGPYRPLEDKVEFSRIMSANGLPAPRCLAVSSDFVVDVRDRRHLIEGKSDLEGILHEILHRSNSGAIFIKPDDGRGGESTFKVSSETLDTQIDGVFSLMHTRRLVFQESIVQDERINAIYGDSINTVRVHTYADPRSGNVEIVSSLMRFGVGGSVVDNGSASGLFIPVDHDTWTLRGRGSTYLHSGARTFTRHPDSDFELDGFQLPNRDEIASLVYKAAGIFEQPFVGWDIAMSSEGPLVVEGNQTPHLIMAQVASGGLRKHPGFARIFKEFV